MPIKKMIAAILQLVPFNEEEVPLRRLVLAALDFDEGGDGRYGSMTLILESSDADSVKLKALEKVIRS